MAIIVDSGLRVTSAGPADVKSVWQSTASLYTSPPTTFGYVSASWRYVGMRVFCIDKNSEYQLIGGTADNNWVQITSGSLILSASYAVNVPQTASYSRIALTSSYLLNISNSISALSASLSTSASYALTASNVSVANTAVESFFAQTAITATNANSAITASFATNAGTSQTAGNATNANVAISASFAVTSFFARSASLTDYATSSVSSSYSTNADYALTASLSLGTSSNAIWSIFANSATYAGSTTSSISSSYSVNSNYAINATNATNAVNSDTASFSITTSFAHTASFYTGSTTWAISSSLSQTSSFAFTASFYHGTSSVAITASNAISASSAVTASFFQGTASVAITASYAPSSSWAMTASLATGTASLAITTSYARSASYYNGTVFATDSASMSVSSSIAVTSSYSNSASYVLNLNDVTHANNVDTIDYAETVGTATTVGSISSATSAGSVTSVGTVSSVGSAGNVTNINTATNAITVTNVTNVTNATNATNIITVSTANNVANVLTASNFHGTASWALTSSFASSASIALTASYFNGSASFVNIAGYAPTASQALNVDYVSSASYSTNAVYAELAGNATTANLSYTAINADNATTAQSAYFALNATQSTIATSASLAQSASHALTASYYPGTSSYALTASYASASIIALTSSLAATASSTTMSDSASYALSASYAMFATQTEIAENIISSSYATVAGVAQSISASGNIAVNVINASSMYANRIGINTNTPEVVLDVSSSGHTYLSLRSGAVNKESGIYLWDRIYTYWQIANRNQLDSPNGRLAFIHSETNKDALTILKNGNVGINTTFPTAKLYISGSIVDTGSLFTIQNKFIENLFFVSASGDIGIGTNVPQAKLHINGNISASEITAPRFIGTASWASSSLSSSYTLSASYAPTGVGISSSYALTASYALNGGELFRLSSSFVSAQVYHTASQTIPDSGIWTPISFSSTAWDDANFHNNVNNNTRMTVPFTGKYLVSTNVVLSPANSTGVRYISFDINGDESAWGDSGTTANSSGGNARLSSTTVLNLTSGSYVRVRVFQNSGGPLTVLGDTGGNCRFSIAYLGSVGSSSYSTTASYVPAKRELMESNRIYYVHPTGSDSNDGRSSLTAFGTIQYAINTVCGLVDFGSNQLTISLADGTYFEKLQVINKVGAATVFIQGNPLNPFAVTISGSTSGHVVSLSPQSSCQLSYLKICNHPTAGGSNVYCAPNSTFYYQNVCFSHMSSAHITCEGGSTAVNSGEVYISGSTLTTGSAHIFCLIGGRLISPSGRTFKITGSMSVNNGFIWADTGGVCYIPGNSFAYAAGATVYGPRHAASLLGCIWSNGTVFPGSLGGTTSNGGVYA